MATLFLMCGLPGSGKTTRAKELERERYALRLTPDEWISSLWGADLAPPLLDQYRDPVEQLQWSVAERALRVGANVILDWGFWSREERDDFRARAAALGAEFEIHFCDAPLHVLLARLAARNADLPPHTFAVTNEQLSHWATLFEPPTADELLPR